MSKMLDDSKHLKEDLDDGLIKTEFSINESIFPMVHLTENTYPSNDNLIKIYNDRDRAITEAGLPTKNTKQHNNLEKSLKTIRTKKESNSNINKENANQKIANATYKKMLNDTKIKLKENNFHKIATPIRFGPQNKTGHIGRIQVKYNNDSRGSPDKSLNINTNVTNTTNINTLRTGVKTEKKKPKPTSISKFNLSGRTEVKKNSIKMIERNEKNTKILRNEDMQHSNANNTQSITKDYKDSKQLEKSEILKITSVRRFNNAGSNSHLETEPNKQDRSNDIKINNFTKKESNKSNSKHPVKYDRQENELKIILSLKIDKSLSNKQISGTGYNKSNEYITTHRDSLLSARINGI